MAEAQKPDFVFRRNGRVHLNRRERQFSRLLATEVCASAVVMLDTSCSKVVWRILATHPIPQFPLHFLSRASPCAITFQLDSALRVYGPYLRQPASKGPTTEASSSTLNSGHIFTSWPHCVQTTSSNPGPIGFKAHPHIQTQIIPDHILNSWPK